MKLNALIILLCCVSALGAEPFDKYQVILTRKPFGAAAAPDRPKQTVSTAQNDTSYRLSALYGGVDGTMRVGLVDKKTGKSILLPDRGQSGIEINEVDFENKTALLLHNGSTLLLTLTKAEPSETAKPKPLKKTEPRSNRSKRGNRTAQTAEEKTIRRTLRGSLLRKHLQEVQADAIRRGVPPLPIPLTEETDNQLVEEGFLPPQ